MSAKVTLAANIGTGTFTVTATTGASEKAECTFEGELSAISEIKFLNESLVITDSNAKSATAALKGYDQFGEEKTIAGATITATKGEASGSIVGADGKTYTGGYKDGILTLVSSGVAYTLNESVVVSVLYTSGTTPITSQATLTVSSQSAVAEIEFGEITTDKAALKDKRLTADVLGSGNFYVPVTKAKDQYTNDLTADQLNTLKDTSKTLLVSPSTAAGVIAYAGQASGNTFDTKDKQVVMYIGAGDAKIKGEQTITIASAGGASSQLKVTVAPYPAIDTISVEVPDLYVGADAEIVFTATDQYGDAYDMWEAVDWASWTGKTGVAAPASLTGLTNVTFSDGTSFTLGGATFDIKKDNNTKKVKFVIDGGSLTVAKQTVSFNYVTKSLKTGMGTKSVQDAKVPAEVKGLATTVSTSITVGQSVDFKPANIQFFDNYGNKLVAGTDAAYPKYLKSGESHTSGAYYYLVTEKTDADSAFAISGDSAVSVDVTKQKVPVVASAAGKTAVYTVTLIKAKTTGTAMVAGTDYDIVGNSVDVTLTSGTAKNYTVAVKDGKKINVNNQKSTAKLVLSGTDDGGSAITVNQSLLYNVTFDTPGFVWDNVNKVVNFVSDSGVNATAPYGNTTTDNMYASLPATGEVTATCYVQNYDTPVQVKIAYSKTKATPKAAFLVNDDGKAVEGNVISAASASQTVNVNAMPTYAGTANTYYAYILDDYGDLVTDATLKNNTTGSAAVAAGVVAKYVLSKGGVSETIDVTNIANGVTFADPHGTALGTAILSTPTVTVATDTTTATATVASKTVALSATFAGAGTATLWASTDNATFTQVTSGVTWATTGGTSHTDGTVDATNSAITATATLTRGTYYKVVVTPTDSSTYSNYNPATGSQFGYATAPTVTALTFDVSENKITNATTLTNLSGVITIQKDGSTATNGVTITGSNEAVTGITAVAVGSGIAAADNGTANAVINWDDAVYGSAANTTVAAASMTVQA